MRRVVVAGGLLVGLAAGAAAWPVSHGQVSGNRVAVGHGTFPRWRALAFATEAPVRWMVTLPSGHLAGVDAGGTLLLWEVVGGAVRLVARYGDAVSGEASPAAVTLGTGRSGVVAVARDGRLALWTDGVLHSYDVGTRLSPLSAPTPVARREREWDDLLAVAADGAVVLLGGLPSAPRVTARVDARALPDARITLGDLDGDGMPEAVVLTDPTDRYAHGVLGDALEAAAVTALDLRPNGLAVRHRFALAPPSVFEDLVPVLASLDGTGRVAVILARSTPTQGAAVAVLAWREGALAAVAEGAVSGRGQRWVHVLAAGDLSGDGAPEILAVRTPHAGGIVSALSRRGAQLVAVANAAGYASHGVGSRNQDQGLLADLDGNGRLEVVVPRQGRQAVAGLEVLNGRFVERWAVELRSALQSNVVAADLDGDGLLDQALADRGALHVLLGVR